MFASFETTDPRDTVYALLSPANDVNFDSGATGGKEEKDEEESSTLIPDYHKHHLDVFIEFAQYCLTATASLDVICRHGPQYQRAKYRPGLALLITPLLDRRLVSPGELTVIAWLGSLAIGLQRVQGI
jgi:hypothetical protein